MHGKYTNFYLISLLEPPPAEWSDWTWWTPCKKSCGGGHQLRYRSCDNPPPAPGAAECSGERNQTLECNVHPCPGMKFCGSYIFTSSMWVKPMAYSPNLHWNTSLYLAPNTIIRILIISKAVFPSFNQHLQETFVWSCRFFLKNFFVLKWTRLPVKFILHNFKALALPKCCIRGFLRSLCFLNID